ncbi:hypothetical protein [Kozakia baliensis]|nr:hypothetical protein [Kozakia baliensis]
MTQSDLAFLYEASIAGRPLRFFWPPAGRPDFPWVAITDLLALSRLTQGQQQAVLEKCRNGPFREGFFRCVHADAILTACPAIYARDLCDGLSEEGHMDPVIIDRFIDLNTKAFKAQAKGMPDRAPEWFFQAMGAHVDFSWP